MFCNFCSYYYVLLYYSMSFTIWQKSSYYVSAIITGTKQAPAVSNVSDENFTCQSNDNDSCWIAVFLLPVSNTFTASPVICYCVTSAHWNRVGLQFAWHVLLFYMISLTANIMWYNWACVCGSTVRVSPLVGLQLIRIALLYTWFYGVDHSLLLAFACQLPKVRIYCT